MKASILTIGTEITDGQIIDSNSQWISQQLYKFNIPVDLHMSVPDDQDAMKDAILYALSKSQLVFICGGLGPTSDDFTRDIISSTLGLPLELDTPSWATIQQKLNGRGVTLREGHRRQALIPQTSQALDNEVGVAPGFFLEHNHKKIWVLPGPPKEISAIWNKHIETKLQTIDSELELHSWLCSGHPESELAHITEEFFSKYDFKKKFGYRFDVHRTVEIKVWVQKEHPESKKAVEEFNLFIDKYLKKEN